MEPVDEHRDRREFFRNFVSDVARGVQEITAPSAPEPLLKLPPLPEPTARAVLPGAPARARVTLGELLELADASGLARHSDTVQELCRPSVRLTRLAEGEQPGRSQLGGAPELPGSASWPHREGEPLVLLAQLDLAEVAAALQAPGPLPSEGVLWCFYEIGRVPSGLSPRDAASCHVALHAGDEALVRRSPPRATMGAQTAPIALSAELTLPRVWSDAVQALGLDDDEQLAWTELRSRLAALQGVELADERTELLQVHRLLGYPDERRGAMQLACELLAEGIELGEDAPTMHPRAAALKRRARRWRLLLELTLDDELGWDWGAGRERLYVWIDAEDLAARDFSRVWAIAQ